MTIRLTLGTYGKTVPLGSNISPYIFDLMAMHQMYFPIYYKNPEEWFYPSEVMELVQEVEVIVFTMDERKIFEFPSTQTEFKLNFLREMKDHQNPMFPPIFSERPVLALYNADDKSFRMCWCAGLNWKIDVKKFFRHKNRLFLHYKTDPEERVHKFPLYMTLNDAQEIALSGDLKESDDTFFVRYPDGSIETLQLLSFMFISTETPGYLGVDMRSTVNAEVLEKSFKCPLSATGHEGVDHLKANILAHFKVWDDPNTKQFAPIASLPQGSGSGKSRLAIEMLRDGPGFYIVFRPRISTAYPKKNELSHLLKEILNLPPDPIDNLSNLPYADLGIGRILMFFAKVVTAVMAEWAGRVKLLHEQRPQDPIRTCVRGACAEIGSMFYNNKNIDCFPLLNETIDAKIVQKIRKGEDGMVVTVSQIADYIQTIVNSPVSMLLEHFEPSDEAIFNAMQACLSDFPFIFLLDGVGNLDDEYKPKTAMPSLQILRSALSYLKPCTKIFFLTLGTALVPQSYIHFEMTARGLNRTETFQPIILLSNTSIFSKKELPLEKLVIDQVTLTNPIMFKYLATLGLPLWSSLPFDHMVSIAMEKIVHGSDESFMYVLIIWMIRVGLRANATDSNTRTLITSHMATLFDLSPDLVKMDVFYPSDPILAIACRELIKKKLLDECQIFQLFCKLDDSLGAFNFDGTGLSEAIGSMLVLLAIDQAQEAVRPHELKPFTAEMSEKMPDFKWLWQKTDYVLEPHYSYGCDRFPYYYHVVTVESFLSRLLGAENFADIKAELPESTLKGIVNASHAVKVIRTGKETFTFENTTLEPMKLPVADDSIAEKNCNLIDESMLKLGLARQCMFLMPADYFAYDLVLPLVLEDASISFIGVQFTSSCDIAGMHARFHYVKCPKAGLTRHRCSKCFPKRCASSADPLHQCQKCDDFNRLSALYANQISLNICLNSKSPRPFDEVGAALNVVEERRAIKKSPKMTLVSSQWRDSTTDAGLQDPFRHRQFCISTRDFDGFEHLFMKPGTYGSSTAVNQAKHLLNNETAPSLSRPRLSDSPLRRLGRIRAVLYDCRFNYLEYNWELARLRGFASKYENVKRLEEEAKKYYKRTDCFSESLPSKTLPLGAFKWKFISSVFKTEEGISVETIKRITCAASEATMTPPSKKNKN